MLPPYRAARKDSRVQHNGPWSRVHGFLEPANERMREFQRTLKDGKGKYPPLFWEEMGSTVLIEELELAGLAQYIKCRRMEGLRTSFEG